MLAPYYFGAFRQTPPTATNATARVDALHAAADAWTQRVKFDGEQSVPAYQTDWKVACVAAAIALACSLAVTPLYMGWWELGRKPSLNPLETGVAMGAPLLLAASSSSSSSSAALMTTRRKRKACVGGNGASDGGRGGCVNSNGELKHILAQVGARYVRYGAVPDSKILHDIDNDIADADDDDDSDNADEFHAMEQEEGARLASQPRRRRQYNQNSGAVEDNAREKEGGRMRLRLVDVEQARQRGVTVAVPRTGEVFL
jgi:hypothetical protein